MAETAPLSIGIELGEVKTAIPIIQNNQLVLCKVTSILQSKHEKGDVIEFKYALAEPAPSTEGKEIPANFPVFQRVYLFDKNTPAGEIPERCKKTIAQTIDGIFGTGDPGNAKGKPPRPGLNAATVAEAIGKDVVLKFKANVGTEFDGNEVMGWYFPADMKA